MRVIEKPWGKETLFALSDKYAGKIIDVVKGRKLSLQRHLVKEEDVYIVKGRALVYLEEGATVSIPRGVKHRIEAVSDLRLFEVSTPELDDVVRYEDDYGREDTAK